MKIPATGVPPFGVEPNLQRYKGCVLAINTTGAFYPLT